MSKATVLSSAGPVELADLKEKSVARIDLSPGSYVVVAKVVLKGPLDDGSYARLRVTNLGIKHAGMSEVGVFQKPVELEEIDSVEDEAWHVGWGTLSLIAAAKIDLLGTAECFCASAEGVATHTTVAAVEVDELSMITIPIRYRDGRE